MKVFRAYKTELDPTAKQRKLLLQHAGAARWAYNFGLKRKQEVYQAWLLNGKQGKCSTPSAIDLHKELNILKKKEISDGGVPWMYEVSKCAPQESLRNLDKAYSNFFRRCKAGKPGKKGFPKFKSRKHSIGTFTLTGSVIPNHKSIQLPRLGTIKLKESNYLPLDPDIILKATISEKAGRWFVSLSVEQEITPDTTYNYHIGVDVGISNLAVTSEGEVFENPRALKCLEKRLRLLQKSVSRKKKGSNNRKKAVCKVANLHYKISNIRKDAIHKATSTITKYASVIGIETLNVVGMMKNHCLAKAISDSSMSEFHRQLEYKMKWRCGTVIKADRFYPSSKTCSSCGNIKSELSLIDRVYECNICGFKIDRDLNAALNLKHMIELAVSSTVLACCPESSGLDVETKLLVEQELSLK